MTKKTKKTSPRVSAKRKIRKTRKASKNPRRKQSGSGVLERLAGKAVSHVQNRAEEFANQTYE